MIRFIVIFFMMGVLAFIVLQSIDGAMNSKTARQLKRSSVPVCDSLGRFEQFGCIDTVLKGTR